MRQVTDLRLLTPSKLPAHRIARERAARLTPEQLQQTVAWGTAQTPLSGPAWQAPVVLLNDSIQHTGQINYIRRLVSEPDWRQRAETAWRAAHSRSARGSS
jgi:hypothetical protein